MGKAKGKQSNRAIQRAFRRELCAIHPQTFDCATDPEGLEERTIIGGSEWVHPYTGEQYDEEPPEGEMTDFFELVESMMTGLVLGGLILAIGTYFGRSEELESPAAMRKDWTALTETQQRGAKALGYGPCSWAARNLDQAALPPPGAAIREIQWGQEGPPALSDGTDTTLPAAAAGGELDLDLDNLEVRPLSVTLLTEQGDLEIAVANPHQQVHLRVKREVYVPVGAKIRIRFGEDVQEDDTFHQLGVEDGARITVTIAEHPKAETLGHNEKSWDGNQRVASDSLEWSRLTQNEQWAAGALGYNRTRWDRD